MVRVVCSPSDLDTDGAILHAQGGGAPWATFREGPMVGGSLPRSSSAGWSSSS